MGSLASPKLFSTTKEKQGGWGAPSWKVVSFCVFINIQTEMDKILPKFPRAELIKDEREKEIS